MFSAFHCTSRCGNNPHFKDKEKRAGISGLSIANGQRRRKTQNYCGHRGNQSSDLCFFHNHRTPLRTLQSAGTQTYLLQWKPASAGVWGDRLLRAHPVKSKLTLAKDTGGKLLSFSKAVVLQWCKWPGMLSDSSLVNCWEPPSGRWGPNSLSCDFYQWLCGNQVSQGEHHNTDLPERPDLFSAEKENLSQLPDSADQELTRTGEATGVASSTLPPEKNLAFITKFQPGVSSHRIDQGGPDLYELTQK